MDLFNRIPPVYKSVSQVNAMQVAAPAASSGLTSLFGSLFCHPMSPYKTVDGRSANAPASSGFWSILGSSPSYKTAPAVSTAPADGDTDDFGVDDSRECDPGPDEIVVL